MAGIQRETESKYDVAPDFVIGDLAELAGPEASVQTEIVNLSSAYFDTAEQSLLRSALTLRRRTGDTDIGWHLKVPGAGFRTELHWPLGNDEPPDELRYLIRPFAGEAALQPTVTLNTVRTAHRAFAPDGKLVFELADDDVRAVSEGAPVVVPRWREIEVELGPAGSTADLDRAAEVLQQRGAYPSRFASKLKRALQGLPPDAPDPDSAAAVLTAYVQAQCDALTAGHFAVSIKPYEPSGTSEPHEAVHQTRVAARRLRSALRTFAPLFETEPATRLEAELAWFATELGAVRDREVLRSRLARAVEDLPAYLVVGPVAERIDDVLRTELGEHADALLATMRDERYSVLVHDLACWRERPPFTAAASEPAEVLAEYVAAADRKLAKRMRRAAGEQTPAEELHRARKAGKRARYAAEAAASALGTGASKLAKRASRLQTLLGEHQDAIVATELLRRIADQVAEEGGNAFTYGILVADQRRIATSSAQAAQASASDAVPEHHGGKG